MKSHLELLIFQLQEELKKATSVEKVTALQKLQNDLQAKHQLEVEQIKEDLTIAKQAAVTKTREEMNKDKDECLTQQRQELESVHEVVVTEVTYMFIQSVLLKLIASGDLLLI